MTSETTHSTLLTEAQTDLVRTVEIRAYKEAVFPQHKGCRCCAGRQGEEQALIERGIETVLKVLAEELADRA